MTENELFLHRTWIEIDLDRLVQNYLTACSLTNSTVTCVLKANAYGHGAVRVAEALAEAGCKSFAVSCAREALELRKANIHGEILVMGRTEPVMLQACIASDIYLTAACEEDIIEASRAAESLGKTAQLHIKIDTGFHRLGFDCTRAAADQISSLAKMPCVHFAGLYSHLGLVDQPHDLAQHDRLMQMTAWLNERSIITDSLHICDSIGLVRYPDWHHDRVRTGAFLYGVRPSRSDHMPFECHETLTMYTTVAQIRSVKAGEPIGYDDRIIPTRDSLVATLCAGYGDGYPRSLSYGKGKALIHGQLAPVMGLICMDQMMVDVTDLPGVKPGDTAVLLGGGIPYMQMADWANTNRNECLTILSRRPVRVYRQKGRIVTIIDSMLNERKDL